MTTPNAKAAASPALVSRGAQDSDYLNAGAGNPIAAARLLGARGDYVGMWPCKQPISSGPAQDVTPNDNDLLISVGWSDDASGPWLNAGYVTSAASATRKFVYLQDFLGLDMNTDSFLLSFTANDAAPGSNQSFLGCALTSPDQGFYLSARTTGKIKFVPVDVNGVYSGFADTTSVIFDGTDHTFTMAWDANAKTATIYVDGVYSDSYTYSAMAACVATDVLCFGSSKSTTGASSYAYKFKNIHFLRWDDSGLPFNLNIIAKNLHNKSIPLTAGGY